jgi:hypothetical protein
LAPGEIDKLRIINAAPDVINTVRASIKAHYPNGIQREDDNYFGAYQFKLKGQPWFGRQGTDEFYARDFWYAVYEFRFEAIFVPGVTF